MDPRAVLREFESRLEAEAVGELLRSHGIETWVVSDDRGVHPALGFANRAKLLVDAEDFAEAEHLVEDAEIDELA